MLVKHLSYIPSSLLCQQHGFSKALRRVSVSLRPACSGYWGYIMKPHSKKEGGVFKRKHNKKHVLHPAHCTIHPKKGRGVLGLPEQSHTVNCYMMTHMGDDTDCTRCCGSESPRQPDSQSHCRSVQWPGWSLKNPVSFLQMPHCSLRLARMESQLPPSNPSSLKDDISYTDQAIIQMFALYPKPQTTYE